MSALKQTAFRLTEMDISIIDKTVKQLGLTSRTEALRYILRRYADETGVKKRTKRKRKKRS